MDEFEVSCSRACEVLSLNRSTYDYKAIAEAEEDIKLRSRMKELACEHRRYGLPRIHYFLHRERLVINVKRTRRIYCEEKLQLKHRKRKKRGSIVRIELPKATTPQEVYSMDFVHDNLETGRRIRTLNIVDDFTKECIGILVDKSISGEKVSSYLEFLDRKPKRIRVDNGTEFTSCAFMDWAYKNDVQIEFIPPGKPTKNAYIESFNSRLRDECLNEHVFLDLEDARIKIEQWRQQYNEKRPHSTLGMKTPKEFANQYQAMLDQKQFAGTQVA
jgi:putative transposase